MKANDRLSQADIAQGHVPTCQAAALTDDVAPDFDA